MTDTHKKLAEEMRLLWEAAIGGTEVRWPILQWADRIETLGGEQAEECQVRAGEGASTTSSSPPAAPGHAEKGREAGP